MKIRQRGMLAVSDRNGGDADGDSRSLGEFYRLRSVVVMEEGVRRQPHGVERSRGIAGRRAGRTTLYHGGSTRTRCYPIRLADTVEPCLEQQ